MTTPKRKTVEEYFGDIALAIGNGVFDCPEVSLRLLRMVGVMKGALEYVAAPDRPSGPIYETDSERARRALKRVEDLANE